MSAVEILAPCSECDRDTYHEVLTRINHEDRSFIENYHHYSIIQCKGCKRFSFLHEYANELETETDPESGHPIPIWKRAIYPNRIAGRRLLRDRWFLPVEVEKIYEETHRCLCGDINVLAGMGIRAILETVCKEKKASGQNLEKRIDSLKELGLITADETKILHSLRFMGNVAAHEVKSHTNEELSIAFDIIEHLLRGVYILPKQAIKLETAKK